MTLEFIKNKQVYVIDAEKSKKEVLCDVLNLIDDLVLKKNL